MTLYSPLVLFCTTVVVTVIAVHVFLFVLPKANIYIGKRNLHHLYIGAAILVLTVTLLVAGISNPYTIVLAGVAASLVLDELVYLATTRGSDKDYFTTVSYLEAAASVGVVLLFAYAVSQVAH